MLRSHDALAPNTQLLISLCNLVQPKPNINEYDSVDRRRSHKLA